MDVIEFTIVALIVLLIVIALPLYIWWKHPKYMNTYKWVLLISMSVFMLVMPTLMHVENGPLAGLLCAPVIFILGYLRFFVREKIAWGLYDRIQAKLSDDQKKRSRDKLREFGVKLPDEPNDKNGDE